MAEPGNETLVESAPAPEAHRFGWRAKLLLLCFTFVLLLVLDVAAANVYRKVKGHPWPAGNPARAYRIPTDPYHHGLRANYSTDGEDWGGNYRFRTNSLGFKDSEVREVPLVPKGRRIVVIGDSFTEGVGVPFEETFAGRLASALKGVEVLNAGTQSYTPVIYYRKIKHFVETVGLKFDELIVAIDVSDARNELEYVLDDDVVRPAKFSERMSEILRTNSIMLWTIAARLSTPSFPETNAAGVQGVPSARDAISLGSDAEIEAALKKLTTVGKMTWPNENPPSDATNRGVKSMTDNMSRLLAVLKAHDIGLTVVIYPWPDQVFVGDPECLHVRVWRDWCKENGVRFVNAFGKFDVGSPWKRRAEILEDCYIPGDQHFNAEGHRRIAEAILEAMPAK